MKIGIIGSGQIGASLARRLSELGHEVSIANSRGPDSLKDFAAETGVKAVTTHEAVRSGEIVFVAVQTGKIPSLPKDLFDQVPTDVVVVDTGNYYPQERDGRIAAIEDGLVESQWVANELGRPVLKAINTLHWLSLLNEAQAAGTDQRIAIPVAGDDEEAKAKLIRLFDELGFDGVDAGRLDESWRQQPGTPVYAANLNAQDAQKAIQDASPERPQEMRATADGSVTKEWTGS
jgi:8-hydroxy-5-deazaflavin:NADPH oxidoreductase